MMGFFSSLRPDAPGNPEEARLPKNRFRAYFDILRGRFWKLVGLSLLTFLFFVPLYFWRVAWGAYSALPAEGLTEAETLFRSFVLESFSSLVSWPLTLLATFGLGGAFEVVAAFTRQEGTVYLFRDFFRGAKENWKSSLLAGFFVGLGNFLFAFNSRFYPTIEGIPGFLPIFLSVFFALVMAYFHILGYFLLASATVYRFSFKASLKNNLVFAAVLFPKNLLFLLLAASFPLLLELIPYLLVQEILIALIAFYGLSHLALVYQLYGESVFDRFINRQSAPSILGRGLDRHGDGPLGPGKE